MKTRERPPDDFPNGHYHIPHKGKEWQQIVSYLLGQKKGRVLDIPSGNLWLTKILLEHGFECVADDLCYDQPTDALRALNIESNASNLDVGLPRYPNNSFDYVVCFEGLEHIANPYVAVREFHRVLRNSGKLFITLPNCSSLPSRLRFFATGEFSVFPHILPAYDLAPRHLHINPVFPSFFLYVASEIGFETLGVWPFKKLRRKTWFLAPTLIPVIMAMQRFLHRTAVSSKVKSLLDSKPLLMRQELFFSLQKTLNTAGKVHIGDRGYYPSLGIVA
jgi:SAM-dependent methyltransferase